MFVPKHARWAWRALWLIGTLHLNIAFVLSIVDVPEGDESARVRAALFGLVLGALAIGAGFALRRRERWLHRCAVVVTVAHIVFAVWRGAMVSLVGMLAVAVLWWLLEAPTRRWYSGDTEHDRLEATAERQSQLARRRLTADAPDLSNIAERMQTTHRDTLRRPDRKT